MKDHQRNSRRPSSSGPARSKMIPGREPIPSGLTWGSIRSRWSAWNANTGPVWRFGLKFAALMILFYGLILTPCFDHLLYSYLTVNAWAANGILNVFGQDSHVSEITIRSARFAITVRRGCDAIEPSWFFCAALLAFPASLTKKIMGILAGAALLQVLNLVRIVTLYFIGLHYPRFFGPAHVEIWPVVFILVAIALWIGWIGWTKRPASTLPHAAA